MFFVVRDGPTFSEILGAFVKLDSMDLEGNERTNKEWPMREGAVGKRRGRNRVKRGRDNLNNQIVNRSWEGSQSQEGAMNDTD